MALQALGAFAERNYSPSFNITVKAQAGSDKTSFPVTPDNSVVLQSYEVSASVCCYLVLVAIRTVFEVFVTFALPAFALRRSRGLGSSRQWRSICAGPVFLPSASPA